MVRPSEHPRTVPAPTVRHLDLPVRPAAPVRVPARPAALGRPTVVPRQASADEVGGLRAELAELRAELARLRA